MEIAAIIGVAAVLAIVAGAWMLGRLRARHGSVGTAMRVDPGRYWAAHILELGGLTFGVGLVLQAKPDLAPIAGMAGVILLIAAGVGALLIRWQRAR